MIIKGGSIQVAGTAKRLNLHLTRFDTNEFVKVREIQGLASTDIGEALEEIGGVASGTRSQKPFYHASINPAKDEAALTPEQWLYAVNRLGHELGLDGQPRIVVEHVKDGRQHLHVVWSRIDIETMTAISDSNNYLTHDRVSRQLEREFGHRHVEGVHTGDKSKPRPVAERTHAEQQQAERTGIPDSQVKADLTAAWEATATGQEFADAIAERGYILAHGRRPFVVIDAEGGLHIPSRYIKGTKTADIKERFADLDPAGLPTVDEARAIAADRRREKPQDDDRQGDGEAAGGTADASMPPMIKPPKPDHQEKAWERARRLFWDWKERAKELFVSWHRRLLVMIGQEAAGEAPADPAAPEPRQHGIEREKEETKPTRGKGIEREKDQARPTRKKGIEQEKDDAKPTREKGMDKANEGQPPAEPTPEGPDSERGGRDD